MLSRKALGAPIFFHHTALNEAQQQLQKNDTIVLSGPSGAGKTELALQLLKRLKADHPTVYGVFPCSDTTSLLLAVKDFARVKDLPIDSFGEENLVEIFKKLFKSLNDRYPDELKVLVFDDVEPPTEVIYKVDQAILGPLSSLPADGAFGRKWKVIFTCQKLSEDDVRRCDHLVFENILRVEGFRENEVQKFFACKVNLTEEELTTVINKLGCLPMRLEAFKNCLEGSESVMGASERFVKRIEGDQPDVVAQHISLQRVIEQSDYRQELQELITLLPLFHNSNVTFELLASCAEVVLPRYNVQVVKELVKELLSRGLCHAPDHSRGLCDASDHSRGLCDASDPFDKTSLLNFHPTVRKAMSLFRPEADILDWICKALRALTRVMPRDGRGHQSHVIYGYMYQHAQALFSEIGQLLYDGQITHDHNPCILLWTCNLLMSMGYCQLALRLDASEADAYLIEALNWFSKLSINEDMSYDDIEVRDTHQPKHVQRAIHLYDQIKTSNLRNNQKFVELMRDVPRYLRLTPRDKHILFHSTGEPDLPNNHLTESLLSQLVADGKALNAETLRDIYAAELLAEIYATAAKAWGFHRNSKRFDEYVDFSLAARHIYGRIEAEYGVCLMAKVITEREMLKLRLESYDRDVDMLRLEELRQRWEELLKTEGKAYEYGLVRAEFPEDPYNQFLCEEGFTACDGRKCALLVNAASSASATDDGREVFHQVDESFKRLIAMDGEKDPRMQMNHQTTSKTCRNYADFLWRNKKYKEAVKTVLQAFIYLNYFLCKNTAIQTFPELDESCGKAKFLLNFLHQYYESYIEIHGSERLLRQDNSSDEQLLDYVRRLVTCWTDQKNCQPPAFKIMEAILTSSA